MKKSLIALFALCFAFSAQAVYLSWSATTTPWTNTPSNTNAILLVTDAGTTVAGAEAILESATLSNYLYNFQVGESIWAITQDMTPGSTAATGEIQFATKPTTAGNYFLVFYSSDNTAFREAYIADLGDVSANTAGWVATAGGTPATPLNVTFTAATVPEPTALALLALGVAGLALRRRRA